MKTKKHTTDVRVVTLGCSKNLVDSENLVTQLQANDILADHEKGQAAADVVIVNTCGFIEAAKQESIDTVLHYADMKSRGKLQKLYVTGCLSQRYREDLQHEIPEVDAFFGTMELPALLSKFDADYKHELIGERTIWTPEHYAYLKISEGCNRTCSFCAIPLMRGKHVSKPMEAIIAEAQSLVRRGVKEIILIAQELTYYGLDIYKERKLAALLDQLAAIEELAWIRLHYAYPSRFPEEVFDVMARHPNICNYIDMPLQHVDDGVLTRMKRQITQEETRALIGKAREKVPGLCFRTTLMVGFPGETEQEFASLCRFVEEIQFERLGVFEYSHEEQTGAYDLIDNIPPNAKAQRAGTLMEIQKAISLKHNEAKLGSDVEVLIDRKEGNSFFGRTEHDSPEVDNEVVVDAARDFVRVGDFASVEIYDVTEYDLYGILSK
ncbi:MAG: 30S ribosomal protein S12 methylthiotransferase RimO [Saprospiraceae bacterium]|nr:30S ribosomal protein S12 methylthiotransferase RimO [Saprospiraceae bacterium]